MYLVWSSQEPYEVETIFNLHFEEAEIQGWSDFPKADSNPGLSNPVSARLTSLTSSSLPSCFPPSR